MFRRALFVTLLLAVAACAPKPTKLPEPQMPHALLTGGWWHLVEIRAGKNVTHPNDPLRYTVTFNADSSAELQLDCNKGHGKYTASAKGELKFGPIAVTKMFCPPPSLGDRVGHDLGTVRGYRIDGNSLVMSLEDKSTYVWEQASLD